ncbi:Glyoxalase/bleomycin resistance protein/dioxygenase [Rivularia sp. IAM M-261]|nr:Glyoxalase/bleomycin resistance protein/dioxygenase [Rivularia sp. IAM M-261]
MMIKVDSLDHIILTVKDINTTVDFYCRVLGMEVTTFGEGRKALKFGNQKINLHEHGNEFEPKAHNPTPGAADLCFIIQQPVEEVINYLQEKAEGRGQMAEGKIPVRNARSGFKAQ